MSPARRLFPSRSPECVDLDINRSPSLDAKAGSLANLFDFSGRGDGRRVILDPSTGQPTSGEW
jgi:hypothetical protein